MAQPVNPHSSGTYVSVRTPDEDAFERSIEAIAAERVMSRICDQDASLWGADAEADASVRLAWTTLPHTSRSLVSQIQALRHEFNRDGLDHVVLCGMGGSSLAPEVICRTAGVELTVLDSSHPDFVRHAIADRLERSIVVVSSKSGSTVETDSQKRAYEHALEQAGLDPVNHLVIVTDPDSPMAEEAQRSGYRLFTAEPYVGGRYSALTAFGLVPSGLAGADISALLDDAALVSPIVSADTADNPAARLGAFLGTAYQHGVDKMALADDGAQTTGLADWIEQLTAESTGKDDRGILPVVVGSYDMRLAATPDEAEVYLGGNIGSNSPDAPAFACATDAPLGAAFLLWEYAIAVAGRFIGINPFDQPDVESAKQASKDLLEGAGTPPEPDFSQGSVDVYKPAGQGPSEPTIASTMAWLLGQIDPDHGYLAVHAYVDREAHADFAGIRDELAARTDRPVTFGWGPRFLHSTGQYHKGGPATGVFLQITADPDADLAIPGRGFTFGTFIDAQAAGDADVLSELGRPVVRLHMHNSQTDLAYLRGVLA